MKTLVILSLLSLSLSLSAADVGCAKIGKYFRPVTPDAIKLAVYHNVSTCDGKAFKATLKAKGVKMSEVKATPDMIKKYEDAIANKSAKKINGFEF